MCQCCAIFYSLGRHFGISLYLLFYIKNLVQSNFSTDSIVAKRTGISRSSRKCIINITRSDSISSKWLKLDVFATGVLYFGPREVGQVEVFAVLIGSISAHAGPLFYFLFHILSMYFCNVACGIVCVFRFDNSLFHMTAAFQDKLMVCKRSLYAQCRWVQLLLPFLLR